MFIITESNKTSSICHVFGLMNDSQDVIILRVQSLEYIPTHIGRVYVTMVVLVYTYNCKY